MLYFVIGLPGRFTEWCDAATAEIVRRALGPTELVRADTLEEISLAMLRTGASRAVVASRQVPSEGLLLTHASARTGLQSLPER